MPTERDPLLQSVAAALPGAAVAAGEPLPATKLTPKVGPLEITCSTRNGILAGIWVATFLSSLNTTLVATLLPSISSEFNKSHQASWLGTSYLLATCTFTPLYGRLCNVMGRRGANQAAVLFAGFGTLACGLSGNMETLIAARFLSGLGGGGIMTTATVITSDMYSLRQRGLTQGIASIFNSMGMGLGGPLGGYISDRFGWRWAFLIQIPLFIVSFALTSVHLNYVTPGKGKSTKEMLKRIDYGGSLTLLGAVLSILVFLSNKFNEEQTWTERTVYVPLTCAVFFAIAFVVVELHFAIEPVLAPSLLRQRTPVLVAVSQMLVATCNFSVMYNFPTWFQTVLLASASEAGAHLIPNGVSISLGSLFAGWWMHKTGKYKLVNMAFGIFPFISAVMLCFMREDSSDAQLWLSILPLGFGNAVVLQTVFIALLAHLPQSAMAVGTGFAQLFRGTGQVMGVALSAAIFQSVLNDQLHQRIPNDEDMITKIRHSATLVAKLPPDLQRAARDSYAIGLRAVFIMAACSTFLAYLARLPIPDKNLDAPRPKTEHEAAEETTQTSTDEREPTLVGSSENSDDDLDSDTDDDAPVMITKGSKARRLSTYQAV
ncbi:hypothetical protein CERSUDRAFT_117143 [Gelatoporia subvermispora B]|uniref:Major facilitator superfamily (MFS) profile domain-containing protein n=1 Tax=Ceriporiopsis subvermispora (strain B) TaxID=914234 RepID=M2QQ16_CERS8|nr:hypothetical protein CERSUDRAFT_117143 [Gelatoporia subvermispora B]